MDHLLSVVVEARDSFTFLELGAGYGRWAIRGTAARQFGIPTIRLDCVEAEPTHFEWLRQSLIDHDFEPDAHLLRSATVCGQRGLALLEVGNSGAAPRFAPGAFYAQRVLQAGCPHEVACEKHDPDCGSPGPRHGGRGQQR